jgi:hypothetical protein
MNPLKNRFFRKVFFFQTKAVPIIDIADFAELPITEKSNKETTIENLKFIFCNK